MSDNGLILPGGPRRIGVQHVGGTNEHPVTLQHQGGVIVVGGRSTLEAIASEQMAALVASGRDDQVSLDAMAAYAVDLAEAVISMCAKRQEAQGGSDADQ